MIDVNPAKHGVDNPQRRRTEKRPFESWAQLAEVASRLGERERALVIFAAATVLRPGSGSRSRRRDIDRAARVVYVRRAFRNGRIKCPKTEGSVRAVPLQAIALDALEQLPAGADTDLLFPSLRGAYFDLHNFRTREWKPAQVSRRDHTDPPRLRSPAHLRDVRAACRHFNLRPLPLHGRQPDHDRPPLRAPRARWTRSRDQPARPSRKCRRSRVSTAWTSRGHFTSAAVATAANRNGS